MEDRWAVEARVFYNGAIITRVRPARQDEEDTREETRTCEIWIDIFYDYDDAQKFCREYRR